MPTLAINPHRLPPHRSQPIPTRHKVAAIEFSNAAATLVTLPAKQPISVPQTSDWPLHNRQPRPPLLPNPLRDFLREVLVPTQPVPPTRSQLR
jgi:hypothetical protein